MASSPPLPASQRSILTEESYTFSKYFELAFETGDILQELGYQFDTRLLQLPMAQLDASNQIALAAELQDNLAMVDPSSETARREALIFPVLKVVCRLNSLKLRIEYPVRVSELLKGTLDYFVPEGRNLLVVEAKQADLSRGFTQLAVELIALNQWKANLPNLLYGAVTTGESWKFGVLDRSQAIVIKDTNTYSIPINLDTLLSILCGIVQDI
jgi:hypothetical protein